MTLPESSSTGVQKTLPFGSLPAGDAAPREGKRRRSRRGGRRRRRKRGAGDGPEGGPEGSSGDDEGEDGADGADDGPDDDGPEGDGDDGGAEGARVAAPRSTGTGTAPARPEAPRNRPLPQGGERAGRRRRKRSDRGREDGAGAHGSGQRPAARSGDPDAEHPARRGDEDPEDGALALVDDEEELAELPGGRDPRAGKPLPREASGMFVVDKGGIAVLRLEDYQWLPSKWDVYVPKRLVQAFKLRDGMLVHGRVSKGFKHKLQLDDVLTIDGKEPKHWKNKLTFQSLTSVDPDFHYAIGDVTDEVAMRVVDLLAPIGRGQRALLVAPPRTGKTTLLRQFAAGIEQGYPDVQLFVLLIDERPEEATEWQRSITRGKVFASTADESAKHHIELAEAVWKRVCRLVEAGDDVVLLLDSITRLARAYNNQAGSGRTMSGGLDSRAMERPRKIFGSARNTVEAGSLTIIGTCLIDTGSRMDQMVFEEFKGTGNSEIVLSRKLADRRIFPAIDVEKSGTRKEEKLVGTKRLKQIHTLRRVLARMHFAEAMDLLVTRLGEAAKTADFLERFNVDPEA